LDEAGNLDFSPNGTKYFCLSSVTCIRPFGWESSLLEVKNDVLESDLDICGFHASEDRQATRDKAFAVISTHLSQFRIDSLVVEKRKTQPHLQKIEKFFPQMIGYLVQYIWEQFKDSGHKEIIVMTDRIPVNKKRDAVEKSIKQTLSAVLPKGNRYSIFHHPSYSSVSLQVADYCNWAIFRKWESNDRRSYNLIKGGIKSEFNIFRNGDVFYY
jgi:hypothetical protein